MSAEQSSGPAKAAPKAPPPKTTPQRSAVEEIPVAELVEDQPEPAAVAVAALDDETEESPPGMARPRRKSRLWVWISVAACVLLVLLGLGGWGVYYFAKQVRIQAAMQGDPVLFGWAPDPDLVALLDRDFPLAPFNDLHIRAPASALLHSTESGGARVIRLTGFFPASETNQSLVIEVRELPRGMDDSEVSIIHAFAPYQVGFQGLAPSPPQSGMINGHWYARTHLSGMQAGRKTQGFVYLGVIDNHLITIECFEVEPNFGRLKLAESMVTTLYKG